MERVCAWPITIPYNQWDDDHLPQWDGEGMSVFPPLSYNESDFHGREGDVLHFLHIDGREFAGFVKGTSPQAMEIENSTSEILRVAYSDIVPGSVVWDDGS